MVLTLLATAALAQNPNLDAKLSLDLFFQPLEKTVKALSKQTGVPMSVTEELEREPVLMRVKDVPAREVMDRIAQAASAEWRQTSTGWVLERSDKLREKLYEQEISYRAEQIGKRIEEMLARAQPLDANLARRLALEFASVKRQHDANPGYHNVPWMHSWDRLAPQLPVNRTLAQILAAIGPRVLAECESGARIVFSNQPNQLQVEIEADVQPYLDELQAASNMLAREARVALAPDERKPPIAMRDLRLGADTRPVRAVLVVASENLRLFILDGDDNLVASAYGSLGHVTDAAYIEEFRELMAKEQRRIPLSSLSERVVRSWHSEPGRGASDPDLRKAVVAPDETDPLNFVVADIFKFLADEEHLNLVACIPDYALRAAQQANTPDGPNLNLFALEMERKSTLDVEQTDGWLVASSKAPLSEARARVNRSALAKFIADSLDAGYPSLEISAELVGSTNELELPELVWEVNSLVGPVLSPLSQNSAVALRFYNSLDRNQLIGMQTGLPLTQLSRAQIQLLMLLSARSNLAGVRLSSEDEQLLKMDDNIVDWRKEVSEVFSRGLPEGTVTLRDQRAETYVATERHAYGSRTLSIRTPQELASQLRSNEVSGQPIQLVAFAPGFHRTITFEIRAGATGAFFSLTEWARNSGDVLSYDRLPAEFRQEAEQQLAELRAREVLKTPPP